MLIAPKVTVSMTAHPMTSPKKITAPISRLRAHCGSQKMTVAAMQMADMKVWAHRS